MANVNITLTLDSADLAVIVPELCNWANLPSSNANAKQAIINFVKNIHRDAQMRAATLSVKTTIDTAGNNADAVLIT